MAKAKKWQMISPERRKPTDIALLERMEKRALKNNDLALYRRASAVLAYIGQTSVRDIAEKHDVVRSTVNGWIESYNRWGTSGLYINHGMGPEPRLNRQQLTELAQTVADGPQALGSTSGLITAKLVGEFIFEKYDVRYHEHYVPEILKQLGFSVQRPGKRLARADAEKQREWQEEKLPALKKKPMNVMD